MTNGIKAVSAVESCDTVATGPGAVERIKAMAKSVTGRTRIMLVGASAAVLSACGAEAQDATVKYADASKATASAPAEKAPEKIEVAETVVDDEWDLGFGEELAEKTAEAEATAEKLAEKTAEAEEKTTEAEALQKLVSIGEAPTN